MTKINIPPLEVDPNDGQWHGHNGGEMPDGVHEESMIFVCIADQPGKYSFMAFNAPWRDIHGAYRVTRAHVEPPKPREWWLVDGLTFSCQEKAGFHQFNRNGEIVHVREVMTDD